MSTPIENVPETPPSPEAAGVSRRGFLGGAGAAAAGLAAGSVSIESFLNAPAAQAAQPGGIARRNDAWKIRKDSADYWKGQANVSHPTNGDEQRYPNRIGSYSRGLPHNSFGEVDPAAYSSLLAAIDSGRPEDFDAIITSPGGAKLTSPQAGMAFDMMGLDAQAVAVAPPPALASREMAGEMVEHYWHALVRDVPFADWGTSPVAQAAIPDLNAFGADYKGPKVGGQVTTQTLLRDNLPGCTVGPYISQFFWLNTPYGSEVIDRRQYVYAPSVDHNQSWNNFLAALNGYTTTSRAYLGHRRYIVTPRDLSSFVHIDVLFQAYFGACLIMMTPPDNTDTGGGLGVPFNATNPYNGNPTQAGFATWGPPAVKTLLCEVPRNALKATWHKKWQVHRRLRPDDMAGLVEVQVNRSPGRYNGALHASLFSSTALDRIETHNGGTLLLPMPFPEGSPTHPSYTAGHATVAGACVTILKALFDTEGRVIPNPVVPTPDGSALVPYTGPALTVEGELNKIASNVATGRNLSGVHWRSDSFASLRLGQAIAISILRDNKKIYNEGEATYNFRGFDGERIII